MLPGRSFGFVRQDDALAIQTVGDGGDGVSGGYLAVPLRLWGRAIIAPLARAELIFRWEDMGAPI